VKTGFFREVVMELKIQLKISGSALGVLRGRAFSE
jgi:hypothetical protein